METRAAIYVRVSTEEQAKDGYSIQAQINSLNLFAKLYNFKIVKTYSDEGLSGKDMNREKLQELLSDAKNNVFDTLIVWKVSRLSRNLKNLLMIVDNLDKYGITFISQTETFNTCNPVGKMTLQILGSIAEFERSTIIENIKLALNQKAKNGEWLGGKVFGYRNINKKLVIDKNEAEIVKYIFKSYSKGKSVKEIIKHLNTISDKTYLATFIYRILKNPIYYGILRHKKNNEYDYIKGIHEGIITKKLFDKVQKKINTNSKKVNNTYKFLLSGLLKCPYCKKSLVRYSTKKYRYYRCGTYHNLGPDFCKGILINANKIENEILEILKNKLNTNTFKDLYNILEIKEMDYYEHGLNIVDMTFEKKNKIIRYFIKEIVLTDSKNIDKIFYSQ